MSSMHSQQKTQANLQIGPNFWKEMKNTKNEDDLLY